MDESVFVKLTPTPFMAKQLATDKALWINVNDISVMAEYDTHTSIHTRSGVYGVKESPIEIMDIILGWSEVE